MNTKTTIVTMFFNLKILKDSKPEVRPMEFYMKNCVNVLKLPYPMIIFCDETTYQPLKEIRDKEIEFNIIKTEYIIKNINDYEFYKDNWEIIKKNRDINPCFDNRSTCSYLLMGMFKSLALNIAYQKNFFNSEYYAWIDLGCNHIVKEFEKYAPLMIENPNPKISVCYIHYRGNEELKNIKDYVIQGRCGIASTAFTVETTYIHKFYCSMLSIFYEHLLNEVGHTDETVLVYCYDRYPELFNIYNGDYYSIFTNYHKPIQDIETIKHVFINEAISKGRPDLAEIALNKISLNKIS
jgi:hypothetical protein